MKNGIEWYSLVEKKAWLEQIVHWHYAQWGYLRPAENLDDIQKLYQQRLNPYVLPMTQVLGFNNKPAGMFSLLHNTYDFFEDHTVPVLNHLFIAQPYRSYGLFKLVMHKVDKLVSQMKFKAICGFTINKRLNVLYENFGYYRIGESIFLGHKIFLFHKQILSID